MTDTQICVTLRGHTVADMVRDASRATAAGADLVEVRFDNLYVNRIEVEPIISTDEKGEEKVEKQPPIIENRPIEDIDTNSAIDALKDGIQIPVIFTCRAKDQGGFFHGSEAQRITVLESAIDSAVSWVDLEINMASKHRKKLVKACGEDVKIIASSHDPAPSSMDEVVDFVNSNSDSGTLVKCCYRNVDHSTSLHVFEAAHALSESEVSIALMGVGQGGDWTRLHAPLLNQSLVYTTLERDYSLFQRGMVNINDLRTAWRLLEYE
ncbi:MAG: type I 3-dehydroquinate dehydratase [Candidatus Thalassarchaeaceae archaeon]|nr:type I 3-dehydroquinate dehydratase [Candidatus Thalassarchaeaceae archaeon]